MAIDYNSGIGPIPNNTGAFPNVVSNNVTAPGAGDGTPFVKPMIDDAWGRFQDLLNRAGLTPNGADEAAGSSQHFEALRRCFGAPGEVVLWHGQADPASLGIRLLILQGQGVLRTSYPDLDAAVYIGDGNNPDLGYPAYFHADDAAGTIRNTTGAYLILADCRGQFLRGWDPTGVVDPQGPSRKFPDKQFYAILTHTHRIYTTTTGLYAKYKFIDKYGAADPGLEVASGETGDRLIAATMSSPSATYISAFETRPNNYAAKICVRY